MFWVYLLHLEIIRRSPNGEGTSLIPNRCVRSTPTLRTLQWRHSQVDIGLMCVSLFYFPRSKMKPIYVCPNQTQFPFQNGHMVKTEWGRIEVVDGKHQWTHLHNWCVSCQI